MSIFKRLAGAEQRAAKLSNPPEWLVTALTGGSTYSGKSVTLDTSLELAAFYRGCNILANAFATSPCKVYRERGEARESAKGTRAYTLLHDRPNETMAADEYWSLVEFHLETWGNHFSYKERGGDGRIANLWPLDPSRVQVTRLTDGRLVYVIDGNAEQSYSDVDILHIRALSLDGVVGYSTVQLARQSLGSELARQEFQGRFWANDATPGIALIHPTKGLSDEAVSRVKALWKDAHQGVRKAREPAVLSEGMQIQQLTMPLEDAQFIEQARYSRTEIALMLGLPPYMLAGDSGGDSLTYSTTEGHSLDLLKWTIGPRMVRVQSAVSQDPDLMPSNHFAEFETGGILRATTTERYKAWATAKHLTVDEMRAMDNLPPLPNGEGQKLAKQAAPAVAAPEQPNEGDDE